VFTKELKKGSTELLILALLEERPRYGYEVGKLIERLSGGRLTFRIGSLYPMFTRLETRGLITGRWVETAGEPRRRYYRLTPDGRKVLAQQRGIWKEFILAVNRIVGIGHA